MVPCRSRSERFAQIDERDVGLPHEASASPAESVQPRRRDLLLREALQERERHGTILGSLHVPYPTLQESIRSGGMLHELAKSTSKRLLFYCAFGERSAMAVQAAQDAGLTAACHIEGGLDAWKKACGPLAR